MKNMIMKISTLLVALVMVLGMMPAMEAKAYGAEKGTITITNVTDGDKLAGYKIIDITYDATDNTVTYEWASEAIKNAMTDGAGNVTVEKFSNMNEDDRQAQLAKIWNIKGNEVLAEQMATNGEVEWSNVDFGGYLIIPTYTNEVYQLMFPVVQPKYNDSTKDYETENFNQDAKKTEVGITKEADTETTGLTKKVNFTIIADVPIYPEGATYKYYGISDTADAGLTVEQSTIKVYGYANRAAVNDNNKAYFGTLTALEDEYTGFYQKVDKLANQNGETSPTFAIEFDYDKLNEKSITAIKIEYTAEVNDQAQLGDTGNRNSANMTYSNNPFTDANYVTDDDDVTVKTYQLTIEKVAENSADKKLSGAKFVLYREAESTETGVKGGSQLTTELGVTGFDEDKYYLLVGEEMTTGDDGKANWKPLDLGIYYLVETKAPTGYTKWATAQKITVSTSGDNYNSSNGIYTQQVTNSTGFNLPQTGGAGTILFSVVGIALMAGAVVVFIVMKRKEPNK